MQLNTEIVYPVALADRISDIQGNLAADEAVLFSTGPNNADLVLTALPAPANTVVTQGGTAGSTNYTYVVARTSAAGLVPAAGVQTTTGNATLTSTNTNIIAFTTIPGESYNIYRSASSGTPSSTGLIGTVVATANSIQNGLQTAGQTSATFTDTGIAATGNVPTANTTGCLQLPGPVFASNILMGGGAGAQALSSAASYTLTAAQMLSGVLSISGGTTSTVTTLTAAQIVAALPGVKVGNYFDLLFRNADSGNVTLAGGTNVTTTGDTLVIPTVNAVLLRFVFTNVTPGSEAVRMWTGPVGAY